MVPKQRAGKKVATSAKVPLPPPPMIELPIAGRDLFPF